MANIREILPKPYNKTSLSEAIGRVLGSAEPADLG
jgi:hypothetical protein